MSFWRCSELCQGPGLEMLPVSDYHLAYRRRKVHSNIAAPSSFERADRILFLSSKLHSLLLYLGVGRFIKRLCKD